MSVGGRRTRIPICFDVLGTCFTFDGATKALLSVFPALDAKLADAIIQDWFHSAQRDFTYLSMNGDYQPIARVLQQTLPRIYRMHHLVHHQEDDDDNSPLLLSSDDDLVDPVMNAIRNDMSPRPSLVSCSALLVPSSVVVSPSSSSSLSSSPSASSKKKRTGQDETIIDDDDDDDDGIEFDLIAVTNGGLETTMNYYKQAGLVSRGTGTGTKGGWSFVSCDEIGVAKPDQRVYDHVWDRLRRLDDDDENNGPRDESGERWVKEGWFVASHTWDLHAAKKAGFKTAFVTYEEHEVLEELFGKPDIVATDLEDVARQIISFEKKKNKRDSGGRQVVV